MKTVGTNSGRSAIAASALEYTLTTAPQCSSVSPTSARVSSLSSIRKACTPVRSGQANASEAACRADSRALLRALRLPTRPPCPDEIGMTRTRFTPGPYFYGFLTL